ncbi:MAG: hypothetical protein IAE86_15485 [Burkholderiaceae bacterium]|nr:hypothetical protein [Burkholderiaceae bacterium]
MRIFHWILILAASLMLAACGGGDSVCYGGPGSNACDTSSATVATSLTLQLSSTSVNNSGTETVVATATAATSGGATVSGVPVTFSVDSGATFTQASSETDDTGVVTANVNIGPNRANRTITVAATSGSLSATATFVVTGSRLVATAVPAVLPPSSPGRIDYVLKDADGNPMAGQAIAIVGGALPEAEGMTDNVGAFSYEYTSPATTGTISVLAKAGGVEFEQLVQVQAASTVPPANATPTSATISVDPSVVAPNVDATTNYRSAVRALFLDSRNRPIPNMRVRFYVNGYGTFSTSDNIVYTDTNGVALTSFIPGARTSPALGVTITACYEKNDFASCGANSTTKALTIAADPLSITIGTNNLIIVNELTYTQRFVVTAVDIAGRPKANVDITPSIDLPYYIKGLYTRVGGKWEMQGSPYGCPNEDVARTGFYQEAQDINQNGQIDPRKSDVAISMVDSTKTDATGKATLQIEYPKNVGSWLQYKILVSAGVAGTEGRASWTDVLGVPVTDITQEGTPAFVRSPYGIVTTTAVPSINFPPPSAPRGPVPPCENAD